MMYYNNMSEEEIMSHSMRYLMALYEEGYKRACENLGVSSDPDKKKILPDSSYPDELLDDEEMIKELSEKMNE